MRNADLRPWAPPGLLDALSEPPERLRYVVVDEIVDDLVTLAVAPWPGSDDKGRVRFPDDLPSGHLLVHLDELRRCLYGNWPRRSPRVGDAFATALEDGAAAELTSRDVVLDGGRRLADVMPGTVADLSVEARNVAKLAYFAAVAGVQDHATAVSLGQAKEVKATEWRVGEVRPEKWSGAFVQERTASPEAEQRWALPAQRWPATAPADLEEAIEANPRALFYFLLNVGDGDSQLLLLPSTTADGKGPRRAVVVDAGTTKKLTGLMAELGEKGVLEPPGSGRQACALVVATHPHDDHIEGLSEVLHAYGDNGIGDLWEPGYYAPTRSFAELMAEVEGHAIAHCEPTAGMVRYVDGVKITVLAPSVKLRTAYDTYGVDCNDASIVLKLEFPAGRISQGEVDGHAHRRDLKLGKPWSIILGGDAQTRSWSHVTTDFMQMHRGHDTGLYKALRAAAGRDHLAAHILKVSHHASKHGINIELIERVRPQVSLISSVGGGGRYGFPHALATQAISEALAPTARKGAAATHDADLGIHYTGGKTSDGRDLGSIALLVPAEVGGKLRMWRFGDGPKDPVHLKAGQQLSPLRVPR